MYNKLVQGVCKTGPLYKPSVRILQFPFFSAHLRGLKVTHLPFSAVSHSLALLSFFTLHHGGQG